MSVGFGFSAGDFIAALQLVSTVIDALRDSGDSSTEYRALISQLFTLETALLTVKRLEVDDEQHAEYIALRQAACQCQRTIDAFWEKIKKYQPSLRTGGSGSRVRDGWRKIQWALCKKDDLVKFKADLVGHTESIELLLTTLHMGSTGIGRKSQEENQKSLVSKAQESYFGCMERLSQIMDCVTTGIEQGKRMLEMTAEVIQTNVQVFHIVLDIQSIITRIPGQVERQQPVYFIDALGRHAPFHLEFVLSVEALTHVLRSNFRSIGSGSQKIDRGDGPWEGCFRPGQRVDMSMVFTSKKKPSQSCPACRRENSGRFKEDQDIECTNCGIIFRRIVGKVVDTSLSQFQTPLSLPVAIEDLPSPQLHGVGKLKRKRAEDEEEDMALFRRVRVKTYSADNIKHPRQVTLHANEGTEDDDVIRCVCGIAEYPGPPLLRNGSGYNLIVQSGVTEDKPGRLPEQTFCERCLADFHTIVTTPKGRCLSSYHGPRCAQYGAKQQSSGPISDPGSIPKGPKADSEGAANVDEFVGELRPEPKANRYDPILGN
ncbi:uncharacterized protein PAC_03533 [Phialocephala subalpina]|uniref:Uncharacterized protein n=1 Tax=Phialocephala subalpina TaxID=576137 RepID=A0A1L7WLL6_9HELO|nr:uncharacterized protein PAC_03533 [Phialocephala subalpina]